MARKSKPIKVVLHIPDSKEALAEIQQKTNDFYVHSVDVLLKRQGIVGDQRKAVIKELAKHFTQSAHE